MFLFWKKEIAKEETECLLDEWGVSYTRQVRDKPLINKDEELAELMGTSKATVERET